MAKGNFNKLVNRNKPVLVDFYADWCGPCQTMAPILEETGKEMEEKVDVIKVNVDKNQAIAQRFGIRSIPTLILFKNGQIAWRKAGLLTKNQLIAHLQKAL
ncbi:thioredoxin [Fulvitalea axinellae]|uniref:Thioredoxin n=1 Tax=Fulvitalea axinellae TaxID=1182444 RepID=A0AAU9CA27_9BACT|nr:thioredoxin [Fulvitalea axinellae]